MSDDDIFPQWVREQAAAVQPAMEFLSRVTQIAGFDVEEARLRPFRDAHRWLVQRPRSPGIARLKPKEPGRHDWLAVLSNGLLGNTQNAFHGVIYRLSVLGQIEASIHELARSTGVDRTLASAGASVAGGNTLRLDCEYQDFILGLRRTLDYLARAVGAYFKQECWSFRDLAEGRMLEWKPNSVAQIVHKQLSMHQEAFGRFLSTGDQKTVRDRIAHREFVSAGTLNVTSLGVFMTGGGEELLCFDENSRLLPQLEAHARALELLLGTVVGGLISGDRQEYEQPAEDTLFDFRPGNDVDERLKRQMLEGTRGQWQETPLVSMTTAGQTAWQCMICGWKSCTWPPNGFEASREYGEAEAEACAHIRAHRHDQSSDRTNGIEGSGCPTERN